MVATGMAPTASTMTVVREKPIMTMKQILLMNLGFSAFNTASVCSKAT